MWSVTPAKRYESTSTLDRSTGTPRAVARLGATSRFSIACSTKSACSFAAIRVVSEFQNSTSNAGGLRPSR
jgi:hypothetical protein